MSGAIQVSVCPNTPPYSTLLLPVITRYEGARGKFLRVWFQLRIGFLPYLGGKIEAVTVNHAGFSFTRLHPGLTRADALYSDDRFVIHIGAAAGGNVRPPPRGPPSSPLSSRD